MAFDLWQETSIAVWRQELERYPAVIAAQGVARLPALDEWYHREFARLVSERSARYVTRDELVKVTEWKMSRGVWRQRNLVLVRSNPAELVEENSRTALGQIPQPTAPIATLAKLAGVGPATASAVLAAVTPEIYPFFDDLVAAQVPDLGPVDFTLKYYARYADALRSRARELGGEWTPARVEQALWANSGGKAGVTS